MIFKALIAWILIAVAETLHGILRVKLLNRWLGDRLARRFAVLTGSAIILSIGWLTVPWIEPSTPKECLMLGAFWLALMLSFDIVLGRFVFHYSWQRISADFDVTKGGLLGFGMAVLFFTPLAIANWRGLF